MESKNNRERGRESELTGEGSDYKRQIEVWFRNRTEFTTALSGKSYIRKVYKTGFV